MKQGIEEASGALGVARGFAAIVFAGALARAFGFDPLGMLPPASAADIAVARLLAGLIAAGAVFALVPGTPRQKVERILLGAIAGMVVCAIGLFLATPFSWWFVPLEWALIVCMGVTGLAAVILDCGISRGRTHLDQGI